MPTLAGAAGSLFSPTVVQLSANPEAGAGARTVTFSFVGVVL